LNITGQPAKKRKELRAMKRFGLSAAIILAMAISGTAYGAIATTQFFGGQTNLASDNDAEYLLDVVTDGSGIRSVVNVGDIFLGSLGFSTIEDLTGGGGTRTFGGNGGNPGVDEFVAIFAIKVKTLAGAPGGPVTATFVPVSAADTALAVGMGLMSASLKAELDSWAVGSMFSVYSDPAQDYTRVFNGAVPGPDDGDPTLVGADIGDGPLGDAHDRV
jgi:hypothetical protein